MRTICPKCNSSMFMDYTTVMLTCQSCGFQVNARNAVMRPRRVDPEEVAASMPFKMKVKAEAGRPAVALEFEDAPTGTPDVVPDDPEVVERGYENMSERDRWVEEEMRATDGIDDMTEEEVAEVKKAWSDVPPYTNPLEDMRNLEALMAAGAVAPVMRMPNGLGTITGLGGEPTDEKPARQVKGQTCDGCGEPIPNVQLGIALYKCGCGATTGILWRSETPPESYLRAAGKPRRKLRVAKTKESKQSGDWNDAQTWKADDVPWLEFDGDEEKAPVDAAIDDALERQAAGEDISKAEQDALTQMAVNAAPPPSATSLSPVAAATLNAGRREGVRSTFFADEQIAPGDFVVMGKDNVTVKRSDRAKEGDSLDMVIGVAQTSAEAGGNVVIAMGPVTAPKATPIDDAEFDREVKGALDAWQWSVNSINETIATGMPAVKATWELFSAVRRGETTFQAYAAAIRGGDTPVMASGQFEAFTSILRSAMQMEADARGPPSKDDDRADALEVAVGSMGVRGATEMMQNKVSDQEAAIKDAYEKVGRVMGEGAVSFEEMSKAISTLLVGGINAGKAAEALASTMKAYQAEAPVEQFELPGKVKVMSINVQRRADYADDYVIGQRTPVRRPMGMTTEVSMTALAPMEDVVRIERMYAESIIWNGMSMREYRTTIDMKQMVELDMKFEVVDEAAFEAWLGRAMGRLTIEPGDTIVTAPEPEKAPDMERGAYLEFDGGD